MKSEMPVKYWKNLPETRLIPQMLAEADARVAAMRAAMPTDPPQRATRPRPFEGVLHQIVGRRAIAEHRPRIAAQAGNLGQKRGVIHVAD